MRLFLAFLVWMFTNPCLLGQGMVNFANDSSVLSSPPDRLLRFLNWSGPQLPAVGTNYQVQLFYGALTADENALIPVSNPPARLRASSTVFPGTWSGGGLRTLDGFDEGTTVKLQVRVWDVCSGPGQVLGKSQPFSFEIPFSMFAHPTNYIMVNFTGFSFELTDGPVAIQTQPSSQTAVLDDEVRFEVVAVGRQPLSFAWRLNSLLIPGATTNPLILSHVQAAQSGSYSVLVSNCHGTMVSAPSSLTVLLPRVLIRSLGGPQVQVAWLTNLHNYVIETASNLQNSSWQPITNSPAIQGQEFIFNEIPLAAQKFFRLRKP